MQYQTMLGQSRKDISTKCYTHGTLLRVPCLQHRLASAMDHSSYIPTYVMQSNNHHNYFSRKFIQERYYSKSILGPKTVSQIFLSCQNQPRPGYLHGTYLSQDNLLAVFIFMIMSGKLGQKGFYFFTSQNITYFFQVAIAYGGLKISPQGQGLLGLGLFGLWDKNAQEWLGIARNHPKWPRMVQSGLEQPNLLNFKFFSRSLWVFGTFGLW